MQGYDGSLSDEWTNWVDTPDPQGIREKELFPYIKHWIDKIKPRLLADIGCGQGSCSTLCDVNSKYIGIEPSLTLIERAKKLYPSKKFVKGEAYLIPLDDASLDAVMSIWVWSHLDNLRLAAQEMYRVLQPKGKFLIITANPETYDERKTFYKSYVVKNNLLIGTFDLGDGETLTNTTLYLHTKEEIEKAITLAGFKINSINQLGCTNKNQGLYLAIKGSK